MSVQQQARPDSARAWVFAARPKTLAGAGVPVMLGCALAAADGGFRLIPAILCFAFALLMQIDANLINDLWDYLKGSDGEDRLGPERACAQGWITPRTMRRGIAVTTLAACLTGCGLLFYGGWWLIAVGALCVLFAFLYTAGPYPLAYHGWGDLLVILFFGFVPVGCTYYVMCGHWTWQVGIASAACGLVIDTLLMVNNYRDREQDALSGKRTLVVRLGAKAGERLYLLLGIAACLLCLALYRSHIWAAILPLLYLALHIRTWRRMVRIDRGRELNAILGETSRNILLFGLLLSAGMLF
ncbi:1,4-dihydroxy-2-naphthoate polyprenyltransferase [uncultured Alistipes sp.]|jgi:1,4-dihydroxy-2-naphthoate octaprenyltransferase|uniref:1,4-dihydroxy-2-naphthoate polyprenyltransferase n=1 Tax=uncultured Alistipes sp. TaxID=538949 RepID=UPI0025FCEDE8|nr:1,4-dihydroxy-2-naphthoate polyprenyltransferase [uncultured Alistipes sp.]